MKNSILLFALFIALVSCGKKAATCPEFYTGDNCDIEVPPTFIEVKEILATSYFVASGVQPKFIFCVLRDGSSVANTKETPQIAQPSSGVWMNGRGFQINPYATLKIELLDGDTGKTIGTASTQPYQSGKNFPSVLTLQGSSFNCQVRIAYIR